MVISIDRSQNIFDKEEISELINAWVYQRDCGNWSQLKETFWPEGTISVSWFEGRFEQFIHLSKKMSEKGNQTRLTSRWVMS
jgi:hypothetical protein